MRHAWPKLPGFSPPVPIFMPGARTSAFAGGGPYISRMFAGSRDRSNACFCSEFISRTDCSIAV